MGPNDDENEIPGTPDDPGSETLSEPTEPEEPDESGEDDVDDQDNEAQPTMEDEGCIAILPGISREYEIIRLERELGEPVSLEASEIFGVSAEMYAWTQLFGAVLTSTSRCSTTRHSTLHLTSTTGWTGSLLSVGTSGTSIDGLERSKMFNTTRRSAQPPRGTSQPRTW